MTLAIFGLLLAGGLVGLCWKNLGKVLIALVAVMLGIVMAGTDGWVSDASRGMLKGVKSGVETIAKSGFGDDK